MLGYSVTEICWWFWLPLGSYYKKRNELTNILAGLQAEEKGHSYTRYLGAWF